MHKPQCENSILMILESQKLIIEHVFRVLISIWVNFSYKKIHKFKLQFSKIVQANGIFQAKIDFT